MRPISTMCATIPTSGRLILMCDVKRPLNPLGAVFDFFYQGVACASVVPNTPEDRRGLADQDLQRARARAGTHQGAEVVTNRPLYRVVKWSVNILLLLLLLALVMGVVQLLGRLV